MTFVMILLTSDQYFSNQLFINLIQINVENQTNNYDISFFKPTTPIAKFNINITISLVTIWAIAIFRFQLILKIIEKPTPEVAYTEFEKVWDKVSEGSASADEEKVNAFTSA